MSALTDYLENKVIDWLFRGQAFTPPATVYAGLLTAAPSDASAGTEVTGGSYARVAIGCSLANFAGTQGAGTTVASSGTTGTTSNNASVTFPAPTGNWGVATHMGFWDAASNGNLLLWAPLTISKTINNGDAAPSFPAGQLQVQIDN
jgi:hypothetical protein